MTSVLGSTRLVYIGPRRAPHRVPLGTLAVPGRALISASVYRQLTGVVADALPLLDVHGRPATDPGALDRPRRRVTFVTTPATRISIRVRKIRDELAAMRTTRTTFEKLQQELVDVAPWLQQTLGDELVVDGLLHVGHRSRIYSVALRERNVVLKVFNSADVANAEASYLSRLSRVRVSARLLAHGEKTLVLERVEVPRHLRATTAEILRLLEDAWRVGVDHAQPHPRHLARTGSGRLVLLDWSSAVDARAAVRDPFRPWVVGFVQATRESRDSLVGHLADWLLRTRQSYDSDIDVDLWTKLRARRKSVRS